MHGLLIKSGPSAELEVRCNRWPYTTCCSPFELVWQQLTVRDPVWDVRGCAGSKSKHARCHAPGAVLHKRHEVWRAGKQGSLCQQQRAVSGVGGACKQKCQKASSARVSRSPYCIRGKGYKAGQIKGEELCVAAHHEVCASQCYARAATQQHRGARRGDQSSLLLPMTHVRTHTHAHTRTGWLVSIPHPAVRANLNKYLCAAAGSETSNPSTLRRASRDRNSSSAPAKR